MKFKLAVVGCGQQFKSEYLPYLLENSFFELVGIFDYIPKTVLQISEKYNIQSFDSLDALLECSNSIDVLMVIVNNHSHFSVTKKILENNMHVIKEKPFALNLFEANQLLKISEDNNKMIFTTLKRRHKQCYSFIKNAISRLGRIYYIQINALYHFDDLDQGWRANDDLSGALFDLGYHFVDILYYLLGIKITFERCNRVSKIW